MLPSILKDMVVGSGAMANTCSGWVIPPVLELGQAVSSTLPVAASVDGR
jgi:hypothetical protein